jgi:hypothetical protein
MRTTMLPKRMRKMSREERAAEILRREDLTRRLQERIEYHRSRLEAVERGQRAERRDSS